MSVELSTIVITIINIAIMFWILSRFVFEPVKQFMDKRIATIQKDIQDANNLKLNAEDLKSEYETKLKSVHEERDQILLDGKRKGENLYAEKVNEADRDVEVIKERAKREIEQERSQMLNDLRNNTVSIAIEAASKVLNQEINMDKHKELVAGFIDNLK